MLRITIGKSINESVGLFKDTFNHDKDLMLEVIEGNKKITAWTLGGNQR